MATQPTAGHVFPPHPVVNRGSSTKLAAYKDNALIYTNGRGVFIRPIDENAPTVTYFQHTKEVTSAKLSPSGFYVASADVGGTVRVWDVAGTDQILKSETRALGGRISDLAWDGESKRIIAVGEGKDKFGAAFSFDSGNSVGEISGHSKRVNAVAIRHQRPFRAVTGGDDNTLVFFHGAPYKFAKIIKTHNSFVHSVAYSPTGDVFASASADRKLFLYNGSDGEVISGPDFGTSHKGGVFAVDFSKDGKDLISVSADGTCKLWDVSSTKESQSWDLSFGRSGLEGQLVGAACVGESIACLSGNGEIFVLDKRSDKPSRTLYGHQKPVTAFASSSSSTGAAPTFFSGAYDGRMLAHDLNTKTSGPLSGSGHSVNVLAIASPAAGSASVYSVGMDDTLRELDSHGLSFKSTFTATPSLPKSIACDANGTVFVATAKEIQVTSTSGSSNKSTSVPVQGYTPSALAYSTTKALLACGGEDGKVRVYARDGDNLKLSVTLDKNRSVISAMNYSPDGKWLAVGESNGKILVYDTNSNEVKINGWVFHTGRINSVAFSADSMYAVSGSLDTNVYVWSVAKPVKKLAIKNAHAGGVVGCVWFNETTIATAGSDSVVRVHSITLPA